MTNRTGKSAEDFLIEIGVEELPPKSLLTLIKAFEASICEQLKSLGLSFDASDHYATPRRLAVTVSGLATSQPDKNIEALGPAVKAAFDQDGNPTPAALGFAKKLGLEVTDLDQVDTDKGPRLAHKSVEAGSPTEKLLAEVVRQALDALPIAKRMRWGSKRDEFVRPVHWICMLFGNATVDAEIMGLKASNTSFGHRFHADKPIQVSEPSLYVESLRSEGHVMVDMAARKDLIRADVEKVAAGLDASAVIDEALLDEVTALVEWPAALAGKFDERFLSVPSEALISSMKEHQKYFHLVDQAGNLLPHFITVSNIISQDPAQVVNGNERVIRPRLADAAFFYENDLKTNFADFRERLKPIVFQASLGSVYEKSERIATLAASLADAVGANAADCEHAGKLCKNDLVSDMVGEFDNLQGLMGRYYAEAANEKSDVSAAMYEHYLPRFAGDQLPSTATGTAIALADRLDTLTGIFGIGELPTGSKDPFALRRASLGVLRILVKGKYKVSLRTLLNRAHKQHAELSVSAEESVSALMNYMLDRFSAWFEDMEIPVESFLAVRALGLDNPLDIYNRTLAVTEFGRTEEANALAAANKRVSNILSKSDVNQTNIDTALLVEPAETALLTALTKAQQNIAPLMDDACYSEALKSLAQLREPIDNFFDQVMVNAEEPALRANRLALLHMLRQLFLSIADISLLTSEA